MGGGEPHWACAECARKCSKVHGKRPPPSHLSFFKIMLGQFKESLIVPPKFAPLLRNLVGQNIYLEDSNGHRWEVKLLKVDDRLAFQQGWNEFVSYHSIQVGEMLVFRYISTSSFAVQIFSTSGCERSHFCESTESDMHKRCPNCLYLSKDGRKTDTGKTCSCIGDKGPCKSTKPIRTTTWEPFPSPHLHCKTDGDLRKRKRSATECLNPHKDGRSLDKSAVDCYTEDKDLDRKRKTLRTAPCEIPSAPKCAPKDTCRDSNITRTSSCHNMNNISGPQTETTIEYSEGPCISISADADKTQEESQMAFSDVCANVNLSPVSNDVEKGQEGSQMASADVSASQVDIPEVPCKSSKADSWKEKEMVVTMPSEFIPTKVGIENADKSMNIEEKMLYYTDPKMSQTSCGKKQKGMDNRFPTGKSVPNITDYLSDIDISLSSCLEVQPLSWEICSSKDLGCERLLIELPISGLSNGEMVPEEDKSAMSKDNVLDKCSTGNNFARSQNMPLLKCSGDMGESLSAYDMATYIFLLDEQGICHIVQNSIGNPGSSSTSGNLSNNDVDNAKCKDTFAPMAKEIPFHCDCIAKDLCSAPLVGTGNEQSFNETAWIGATNNDQHAQNGHLATVGSDAAAIPGENYAFPVENAPKHMIKIHKNKQGSDKISGLHEHGVKQDAASHKNEKFESHLKEPASHKNEKFESYLKEPVLKAVKTEIIEADVPSSLNSSYFSFSLVVNTLSWHELSEPLQSNYGRWRLERKVVLLRDPAMRVWPVLYHENFKFTGFLGGWEDFVRANNIQKGDTCHFEMANHMESLLQVHISRAPNV